MKDSGIFRIVEKTSKNDTKSKISKGKRGEIIAAKYLSDLSYDILEVNYTAMDFEIDIIAKDKDQIVFVEVKLKKTKRFGSGFEEVNIKKQKKIINCSKIYLRDNKYSQNTSVRYDIISIDEGKINHIKNAFGSIY